VAPTPPPPPTTPPTTPAVPPARRGRFVVLNFDNADIEIVIQAASELLGFNYVLAPDVRGKVTVQTSERVAVEDAFGVLLAILELHGFTAIKSGNLYKIVRIEGARERAVPTIIGLTPDPVRTTDEIITQIVPLRFSSVADLTTLLRPLVSARGTLIAHRETNVLIITDAASNIRRLLDIVRHVDVEVAVEELQIVPIRFADAADLATILNQLFQSGRVRAASVPGAPPAPPTAPPPAPAARRRPSRARASAWMSPASPAKTRSGRPESTSTTVTTPRVGSPCRPPTNSRLPSALNATPQVAFLPLIIVWVGIGLWSKIVVIFLLTVLPVAINALASVKTVDARLLRVAKSFGAPEWQVFKNIILPSSVPFLLTGLRLGVGRAMIGIVVGELYAATAGVGFMIHVAGSSFQTDKVFVGVLIIALTGLGLIEVIRRVERRVEVWRPKVGAA